MGSESYSSVYAKNLRFTATIFLSHGTSVLSRYFHLVSTKCKLNKILDIFIYLKHNKTNLKTPLKSQDGTNTINLTLSITIWPHLGFYSKFVFQHFKCIFSNLLFLSLIYIEKFWHMNYGCTFLWPNYKISGTKY